MGARWLGTQHRNGSQDHDITKLSSAFVNSASGRDGRDKQRQGRLDRCRLNPAFRAAETAYNEAVVKTVDIDVLCDGIQARLGALVELNTFYQQPVFLDDRVHNRRGVERVISRWITTNYFRPGYSLYIGNADVNFGNAHAKTARGGSHNKVFKRLVKKIMPPNRLAYVNE